MIDMTTWRWYVSEIFRAQKGSQATVASTRSNPASKLSPDAEVVVGCADDVVMTKNTRVWGGRRWCPTRDRLRDSCATDRGTIG
jgi:hypothetical protein